MKKIFVLFLMLVGLMLSVVGNSNYEVLDHDNGYGIYLDMSDADAMEVVAVLDNVQVVSNTSNIHFTYFSDGSLVKVGAYLVEYSSMVNDVGICLIGYVEKYDLPLPYY